MEKEMIAKLKFWFGSDQAKEIFKEGLIIERSNNDPNFFYVYREGA